MVPENGVLDGQGNRRTIRNDVGLFDMVPFYQGSFHTQFNPDCADAIFVASFPSEDPGTGQEAKYLGFGSARRVARDAGMDIIQYLHFSTYVFNPVCLITSRDLP